MRKSEDTITFGATPILYSISRSDSRATIAVTVNPEGNVSVTAPKGTRRTVIAQAVESKADWILRQQEYFRQHQNGFSKQYVSGESFFYLGRQYKLKVQRSRSQNTEASVRMTRGLLLVTLPANVADSDRPEEVRKNLVRWYRDRAEEHIPAITEQFAKSLGLETNGVLIRDMKKRWGSASKRRLTFNWRIIMAPRRLVEYVVAHELCHLVHENHSRDFWRLLERAMPDYERRRVELAIIGPKFDLKVYEASTVKVKRPTANPRK